MSTPGHFPRVHPYRAVVGTRTHAGRVTELRRTRYAVDCACGQTLGAALTYMGARKAWEAHKADLWPSVFGPASQLGPSGLPRV